LPITSFEPNAQLPPSPLIGCTVLFRTKTFLAGPTRPNAKIGHSAARDYGWELRNHGMSCRWVKGAGSRAASARTGLVVLTAEECRKNAEECLRWARDAKTDSERQAFLDMARTWTEAAMMADGGSAKIAEHLPKLSQLQRPAD
jgi:hypothetical protein